MGSNIIDKIKNKIYWWLSFRNLKLPHGTYIDQRGLILSSKENLLVGKYIYISAPMQQYYANTQKSKYKTML